MGKLLRSLYLIKNIALKLFSRTVAPNYMHILSLEYTNGTYTINISEIVMHLLNTYFPGCKIDEVNNPSTDLPKQN